MLVLISQPRKEGKLSGGVPTNIQISGDPEIELEALGRKAETLPIAPTMAAKLALM